MKALPKRVVVIAGARGYLGSAIAEAFQNAGCTVVAFKPDITDARKVRRAYADVKKRYTRIDACIHVAAAPLIRRPLLSLTQGEFDAQIEVALGGAFKLFQGAVPLMRAGSVLIGVTTTAIESGHMVQPAGSYLPAKLALRGMLRVLAAELAPKIRVYAIAPGFLPGGLNAYMPERVREFILSKLPAHASREEIATLALELAFGAGIPSGSSIAMPGKKIDPL